MKLNEHIQTSSRVAVETVLRSASQPLPARTISEIAGVSYAITRKALANAIGRGRAHNINPNRRGKALYLWGPAECEKQVKASSPRWTGTYTGEREIALREGSMRAYELPSVQGGVVVERRKPVALA